MRLPEIDYGGSVQSTTQLAGAPYEAAAGLSKTIAEGLAAYHQELIRTQQQEAAVKVSEGLNQAELAIKSRKYVTAQEIRDTLGDNVPAHVQDRLDVADNLSREFGDNSAQAQQIPMWAVGDALYAHAAKRITEAAAQGIDGQGWQSDFKGRIAQHVVDRQASMASHQLGALDTYLQQTQLQQVERLANARDYPGALQALQGSSALAPEVRQKVAAGVETMRQEAPALDALVSNDPAVVKAQLERLKTDPAAVAAIPAEKRAHLVATLDTRNRIFEARATADDLWAQAKGDPAKAVEAARGIKDPQVADEVNKRLEQRAHEDHNLQVMADAPREGRLDQIISRFTALDRASPDYALLSDPGKARVEAKLVAAQRAARATGSEERRLQAEEDRRLLAWFDGSLPLKGSDGADQVSINVDQDPAFATGSPTLREMVKGRQKKAQVEWQKDAGLSRQAFTDKVTATAQALGYDPKVMAPQFQKYMLDKRQEWFDAHPTAKALPTEEARKMLSDALLYGDESGGSMWSRNRYAWQNLQAGKPFVPFAEGDSSIPDRAKVVQQGLRAAPAPAVPAAGDEVPGEKIGKPGGVWKRVQGGWQRVR